ncbi:hypothetical protein PMAYCL1PPCAC_32840 [Pristionchus mayeri]|uniref:Ig-like domain-containing protein n=1 Tax=Pristionchus mayeri TaxID=1317129 RepID=A0AAN5DH01_9BILA|nr:hypothetical protein PMAYCL1PPCAC_32840 [Pristionchus mayeri]
MLSHTDRQLLLTFALPFSFLIPPLPMTLLLILCLFSYAGASSLRAVGNVAIVARATHNIHTPSVPVFIHATKLTCGAEHLGEAVAIRGGEFVREGSDRAPFEATLARNKAVLEIGKAPLRSAGRYKCEVITSTGDAVTGNLQIYLAPVIELEHDVDEEPTSEPHAVLLQKRTVRVSSPTHFNKTFSTSCTRPQPIQYLHMTREAQKKGTDLTLDCNSYGYPQPFLRWEKDGQPLEGQSYSYEGDSITIKNLDHSHSGVYSCHAENSFPLFVGGPSMPHQTTLRVPIHVQ